MRPVIKGVSYFIAHVPSLIRHGSKPTREIKKNPVILVFHLESFADL